MTKEQAMTAVLERRMQERATLYAPELRRVGQRFPTTRTGIEIGSLYENRLCCEDAEPVQHYRAKRDWLAISDRAMLRIMAAIGIVTLAILLADGAGWLA